MYRELRIEHSARDTVRGGHKIKQYERDAESLECVPDGFDVHPAEAKFEQRGDDEEEEGGKGRNPEGVACPQQSMKVVMLEVEGDEATEHEHIGAGVAHVLNLEASS